MRSRPTVSSLSLTFTLALTTLACGSGSSGGGDAGNAPGGGGGAGGMPLMLDGTVGGNAGGTPAADAGPGGTTGGTPVADAGPGGTTGGTPTVDAGTGGQTPTPDAATPPTPDAATPPTPDAATPPTADAATPPTPDAATPPTPDAGGCPDADHDGLCDDVDDLCNADDLPKHCRQNPPDCPAGQVPILQNSCYVDICTDWATCGQPGGPCHDGDRDQVCDPGDAVCNPDGFLVECHVAPPACPAGEFPVTQLGCFTGLCIPYDACESQPCADADQDGLCDGTDNICNGDAMLVIGMPLPACPAGTVALAYNGTPTGDCVPWNACVPGPCPDADHDGLCDFEDTSCDVDGQGAFCPDLPPDCPVGLVPQSMNGCWLPECVAWADCHPNF